MYADRVARGFEGRLVIGLGVAACAVFGLPPPVTACSGPELTFDRIVADSQVIVEGTAEEVLLDGLAYRLTVTEVFKGSVGVGDLRVGPTTAVGRGCDTGMAEGDHVILAVPAIDQPLNALTTAVWVIGSDGSLSSTGSLWTYAADADDLRAKLRAALPDTALPNRGVDERSPWPVLAFALALGVTAAVAVAGARLTFGRTMPP